MDERIHVIWICISSDDAGSVDCLKSIIDMCAGNTAIIVVFTKFDELVFKNIMDIPFDNVDDYMNLDLRLSRAKDKCRGQLEDVRKSLVRDSGVATVYTSVGEDLPETLEELVTKTEDAMRKWLNARSRATLPILAWSVAQKYSRRIKVETSAHIGQWRFWSDLAGETFLGMHVQRLVDAIHADLVGVWNLGDPSKRLSSDTFKTKMLYLVNELVEGSSELSSTSTCSPSSYGGRQMDRRPKWVNEVYQASVIQIGQLMTYVVSLSVILRKFLDKGVNVTEEHMEIPMDELVDDDIRTELREAVRTVPTAVSGSDGMVIFNELKRLVSKFCLLENETDE
ncbi:hypothetical protein K474DRAFT_461196 [Panus rudis PR-1116 ss-1]|nr:hypothetical protein K474DRAFT_461196 [Panus rudis PR-1116 ss-1]